VSEASSPIDTRGIPSRSCLCGSDTFKILVRLDDDNTIGWYSLSGYCYGCGAAVTIPTPEDAYAD
jgi:hypothetical protein